MFALPLTEESGNWAVPPKRGEFMCQLARQISQNVCRHRTVHRWCIRVLVLRNKGSGVLSTLFWIRFLPSFIRA
ncbi:hypothetical protein OUZ56_030741 [Daphnia magna]|uniref:Uncharacterized protein n=1 Tax=Daphnia magna TaxID=35525 RepID=A0ABQ9ZS69_9CRUS|nr:hypothetical protein OUZ56_030741 [Daphnia magna]